MTLSNEPLILLTLKLFAFVYFLSPIINIFKMNIFNKLLFRLLNICL